MNAPLVRPQALDQVNSIEARLRLMVAYLQLYSRGVVDQPLPHECYVNALRDATPEQRVRIALALLDLKETNPNFNPRIPAELLALALYETDDPDELSFRVPWTKSILKAIADLDRPRDDGRRRTIPIELRIPKRVLAGPDDTWQQPQVRFEALLRITSSQELGRTLKNYRWLVGASVIEAPPPSDIMAAALSNLADPGERLAAAHWAYGADMLSGHLLDATLLAAIDQMTDPKGLVDSQLWYLEMLRMDVVATPLRPDAVVRGLHTAIAAGSFAQFHKLVELLPDELLEHPSIEAVLDAGVDAAAQRPPQQVTEPTVAEPTTKTVTARQKSVWEAA